MTLNAERMKLNRRLLLKMGGAAAVAGGVGLPFLIPRFLNKPNILVVIADDMRWDAMGVAGSRIVRTPHLDRLAKEGCYFANHFVTTSICPTSRASIMTGQYARRHKVYGFTDILRPPQLDQIFPVRLRRAGWQTCFIGKWGFGDGHPLPAGRFDAFHGFGGQGDYRAYSHKGPMHLNDFQTMQALTFLRNRNTKKPFLMVVSTKAPHKPIEPQPRFRKLYNGVKIPRACTDTQEHFRAVAPLFTGRNNISRYNDFRYNYAAFQNHARGYYALITGVDAVLGNIVEGLRKAGELENTIVVFTSDNGYMLGEHGIEGKNTVFEESIRAPLIIRAPGYGGRHVAAMTLNIDIGPTVLDMAGVAIPERMQGLKLVSAMNGGKTRQAFYYEHPVAFVGETTPCEGLRTEEWKYMRYWRGPKAQAEMIFNLKQDRFEERNLAKQPEYAGKLAELRAQCVGLRKQAN